MHRRVKQDTWKWRYHRRLLDYQSPFFQLKFPLDHWIPGIIEYLGPSNSFAPYFHTFIWPLDHQIVKENFSLKILLDHKSSDLNKTYKLYHGERKKWTHTDLELPTHLQMGLKKLPQTYMTHQARQPHHSNLKISWEHLENTLRTSVNCSEPFLIYIYGIQCDFIQKRCWKHTILKIAKPI